MMDQPKPVHDLSREVISLARRIDRLPPGEYTIVIVKPEYKGKDWRCQVDRVDVVKGE